MPETNSSNHLPDPSVISSSSDPINGSKPLTSYSYEDLQSLPEEDLEVEITKDYGIGIDCHSQFIYVCILAKNGTKVRPIFREFPTDWQSLVAAKEWCLEKLREHSNPIPDLSKPIHYCLESTAQYHVSVTFAWEGTPTIINPSLAGQTKRKTDRLDARNLAHFDLNGTWRESYIPSMEIRELRLLLSHRARYRHDATRIGNAINNCLLGFGMNIGREGSVVINQSIRAIVEDQISDNPSKRDDLCPTGIPVDVRQAIRELYERYDTLRAKSDEYLDVIRNKVVSMQWETANGTLPGDEMLALLATVPNVGEITAITWLAYIITPRRFPNSKAVAAYCGLDPSLKISAGKVTSTTKRGGHKALHSALCLSGSSLIKHHNEMFGRWGYQMYCKSGRWKKATNAVARKLCNAMYFIQMTGQPFSYDKYNIAREIEVFDIPVTDLQLINREFKRYEKHLHNAHIYSTKQLATAYLECTLGSVAGLGKKFFMMLDDFFAHQYMYKKQYDSLMKERSASSASASSTPSPEPSAKPSTTSSSK